MSNLLKQLNYKIRCKLSAVGGPDLDIQKGFTCHEAPKTYAVKAVHGDLAKLTAIRSGFVTSLETDGYVHDQANRWLLERDGLFIYILVEDACDARTENRFEVSPRVYNVKQN